MSYLQRDQNDILGPNVVVELPQGAGAPTQVGLQIMEPLFYFSVGVPAPTSEVLFIVPQAASNATSALPLGTYRLMGVSATFTTTSTSGTLQITHDTGVSAPGSGTAMLSSAVSLSGTANTVVSGVPATTLSNAQAILSPGDRLSISFGGTLTGLVNLSVSVYLARNTIFGGGIAY